MCDNLNFKWILNICVWEFIKWRFTTREGREWGNELENMHPFDYLFDSASNLRVAYHKNRKEAIEIFLTSDFLRWERFWRIARTRFFFKNIDDITILHATFIIYVRDSFRNPHFLSSVQNVYENSSLVLFKRLTPKERPKLRPAIVYPYLF